MFPTVASRVSPSESVLHLPHTFTASPYVNPIGAGMDYTMIFGLIYAEAQNFPVCFHQRCQRDKQKQIWQADSRRGSEGAGCKVNWQWE